MSFWDFEKFYLIRQLKTKLAQFDRILPDLYWTESSKKVEGFGLLLD